MCKSIKEFYRDGDRKFIGNLDEEPVGQDLGFVRASFAERFSVARYVGIEGVGLIYLPSPVVDIVDVG